MYSVEGMPRYLFFTPAFIFYAGSFVMAQVTLTVSCSQDAALGFHDGAFTAGNNYGTAIQNAAFWIPASADPNGFNGNRALIDFQLPAIPSNAVFTSASLNLYALGPAGTLPGHTGPANSSCLRRITQSWQEMSVTWNSQPAATTVNQVILPSTSSSTKDYTGINVTALVNDMYNNPQSSFGFLLRLVNESASNALLFASRDHSDPALHPVLHVTYTYCQDADGVPCTSLPDRRQEEEALRLFPVPATGELQISVPDNEQRVVTVYAADGRMLLSGETGSKFSVSGWVPGAYLCRVVTVSGKIYRAWFLVK